MLPRVQKEVEQLLEEYPDTEIKKQPNGSIHIEIPNVPLPEWWNQSTTRLLIVLQPDYPNSRPTFFAEPTIRLKANNNPPAGSGLAAIEEKQWMSFCWNPSSWDLSRESLWKFVKFAQSRFLLQQ